MSSKLLVVAEHDQTQLSPGSLSAITAAMKIGAAQRNESQCNATHRSATQRSAAQRNEAQLTATQRNF
jgi:hypothetical protein